MTVRTRFAPSPTGYLHIGGVRTALFCWLFARRHGGQFILRIDDTDQQRNVEEALAPILHGLHWLGIDWDEGPEVGGPYGPYYQSQRGDRYQAAVEKLLAGGAAYYDYATTEELQAEREAAEREKQVFLYSRRFMAETAADRARFEAEGRKPVVRLKMPREGTLVIQDVIRGDVAVDWAREQDHVIQRADGSFLYHLANVVDDYDFKITHVIRAEEHLSNTPRQIFIAQSLGYELPIYAHLPFVAEPGSKTKLSKRKLDKYLKNADFAALMKHGRKVADALGLQVDPNTFNPVVVDFYEQVGYLPEAIINYLALLGWALDDQAEHFSREELIRHFSLERVNKAAASFDPKKLWSFQDWHMQQLPLEQKVERVVPYLQRAGSGRALWCRRPACTDQCRRDAYTTRAREDRTCRPCRRRPHQDRGRHPRLRLFLRCRRQARLRREGRGQVAAKAGCGRTLGQVLRPIGGRGTVRGPAAGADDPCLCRGPRREDRRHRPRAPRRGDRPVRRPGAVRQPGDSRQSELPGEDRADAESPRGGESMRKRNYSQIGEVTIGFLTHRL